jgi:outer membrane lipoprotein SlyB
MASMRADGDAEQRPPHMALALGAASGFGFFDMTFETRNTRTADPRRPAAGQSVPQLHRCANTGRGAAPEDVAAAGCAQGAGTVRLDDAMLATQAQGRPRSVRRETAMGARFALVALAMVLLPASAQAQEGAAAGAVTGAVAGAIIAGPLGAVIGGVAGAAAGGAAQEATRKPRGTVTVRPASPEPIRVRTCVRDDAGRQSCTVDYR